MQALTGFLAFRLKVAEVNHLEEEIMALHSEIVELQRSPYARRQGEVMEQLCVNPCKQAFTVTLHRAF